MSLSDSNPSKGLLTGERGVVPMRQRLRSVLIALVRHPVWTTGMLVRSWERRHHANKMRRWRERQLRKMSR